MSEVIQVDDLHIEVRRSARRKTVDLIVDRFGDLVMNVPDTFPRQDVESIVRRKQEWIYTKLEQKEAVLGSNGQKEYVTGEGFCYLGKKYRLKLIDPEEPSENAPPLRLRNGRFLMIRDVAPNGRIHFVKWYTRRAQAWISDAVGSLKERVLAEPRSIMVRDLKFRWGSCNAAGDVYFHWRVILLPPKFVRYLVLHELVHLHEHNHSPAFYDRLRMAAPDHREIESWLEANGDQYAL
jgi:predicted metal-dependent hydrolase